MLQHNIFKSYVKCSNRTLFSTAVQSYNNTATAKRGIRLQYNTFQHSNYTTTIHKHNDNNIQTQSDTNIRTRIEQAKHTYIDINSLYAVIKIHGTDALKFLQGLCTNDMRLLTTTHNSTVHTSIYTAFLNTKGRILFDAFITQAINSTDTTPTYYIEINKDNLELALNHFKLYNLRQNLTITHCSDITLYNVLTNDSNEYNNVLQQIIDTTPKLVSAYIDPRLPDIGIRVLINNNTIQQLQHSTQAPTAVYSTYRYIHGLPYSTTELQPSKSLPLECNIDLLSGVSFNKGCYLGQELTNRSQSQGIIRKRLYPVFLLEYSKNNERIQLIRDKLYGKPLSSIDSNDTQAQYLLYDALIPVKTPLTVHDTPIVAVDRESGTETTIRGCNLLSINNKISIALLRNEYVINNTKYDLIATLNDNQKYYVVPFIPTYMSSMLQSSSATSTDTTNSTNETR